MLIVRKRVGCTRCDECVDEKNEIVLANPNVRFCEIEIVLHDKYGRNIREYWCVVGEYIPTRERIFKGFMPIARVWGNFWPRTSNILALPENLVVGKPFIITINDITTKRVLDRKVSLHPIAHLAIRRASLNAE